MNVNYSRLVISINCDCFLSLNLFQFINVDTIYLLTYFRVPVYVDINYHSHMHTHLHSVGVDILEDIRVLEEFLAWRLRYLWLGSRIHVRQLHRLKVLRRLHIDLTCVDFARVWLVFLFRFGNPRWEDLIGGSFF